MTEYEMHEFNGVRYRAEDARRLGLIAKGAVLSARSERVQRTVNAPAGLVTSQAQTGNAEGPHVHVESGGEQPPAEGSKSAEPAADPNRPNNGQSKNDWAKYALSVGVTPEALEGLRRDEIIAAVDQHQAGNTEPAEDN